MDNEENKEQIDEEFDESLERVEAIMKEELCVLLFWRTLSLGINLLLKNIF